jgi:hypothetical protein
MNKRLIPVIHLIDLERLILNIETCLSLGVNNVFIINHQSDWNDLLNKTSEVKKLYPELWIGLNFLDLEPREVSKMYIPFKVDAFWFDKSLQLNEAYKKDKEIFSGINFKYQKQFTGYQLDYMVDIIKLTSTVACTSGVGTGKEANQERVKELKEKLGDFPLALCSGVSSNNIRSYLPYVDDFLVASSITNHHEIIQPHLLKELIDKMNEIS